MAVTLSNKGLISNAAQPVRIYKLSIVLDATATTAALAHGCPEAPVYFYNANTGTSAAVSILKAVANSSSATTVTDFTLSGAGTNAQTVEVHAYIFNQGS